MFLLPIILCNTNCGSDPSASDPPFVHVKITQPKNGDTLQTNLVRIMTDLEKNCGCSARVEYSIDGVLTLTDFTPAYSFDWYVQDSTGTYTITARGVVEGKAEGLDSVIVTITH